jgi:hypothetical protein
VRLPFVRDGQIRVAGPWLSLAILVLAVLAICLSVIEPPAPRAGEVAPGEFSEPRARVVVDHLSENIGVRLNGTAPHRRAAEFLASELRKVPGFEVEIQQVGGTQIFSTVKFPAFVYRTLNVVGRLPGRSAEAVLLDAHFDTQLDSVGAADDAAGVAVLLETVRVLAREAPLGRSLIVNLNGAEEIGLLGAAGFLEHRWAKDVRAYVYVEALPGGRAALFGAGAGNPWLAKTYARSVPRPFGNVIGQDLLKTGLLPHNGDFTPFHEAGLAGLDVAMTGDGWAYHTMLDRTGRLQPGSLQHLGDSILAVTRALAKAPLPGDDRREGAVFYDILGLTMAAYSTSTARGMALLALGFALAVVVWAGRRGLVSFRTAVAAFGWTLLAVIGGLAAAVAAAAVVSFGLGRPSGWFSSPALAVLAFGATAGAGITAIHALWRRRGARSLEAEGQVRAALVGGLIFWSALLALSAAKSIGAGYVALYWVLGGALALLLSVLMPRAPLAVTLACLVPATVVTLEVSVGFLSYFIPITGMLALAVADVMIAALVGATVALIAPLALAAIHRTGGFARAALVLSGAGVLGLVLIAGRFPYTKERPKRVTVSHVAERDRSALRIKSGDGIGMTAILTALRQAGFAVSPVAGGRFTYELAAPPPPMSAPQAEVEAEERTARGERTVTLRIHGTSPAVRLRIRKEALSGWSLAPSLEATPPIDGHYVAQFWGLAPAGHSLKLVLRETAPVEIELRGTDGARASGPQVESFLEALPAWVTASCYAVRTIRLKI